MDWERVRLCHWAKNISGEQKKIIYISAVGSIFLFSFLVFVYGPQSKKFSAIKKELSQTENQIKEIMGIVGGRDLPEAVRELKTDFIKITAKLPPKENMIISGLSENAKRLNLEVRSISPSGGHLLANAIPGYDIEELPVSLNLVGDYRALGEYLHILRDNPPILIRVRQLEIKGKGEGRSDLDVALQICAYLSRKK
jgi:Tfp pilus assembly protein PilO